MCKVRSAARVLVLALSLAVGSVANAMVQTASVRVASIDTYTDYAAGDVVFTVDSAVTGCDGFWLRPTDGGFKSAYAALLMSKASGGLLKIYAYDNELWPGSLGHYCRVRTLSPQ